MCAQSHDILMTVVILLLFHSARYTLHNYRFCSRLYPTMLSIIPAWKIIVCAALHGSGAIYNLLMHVHASMLASTHAQSNLQQTKQHTDSGCSHTSLAGQTLHSTERGMHKVVWERDYSHTTSVLPWQLHGRHALTL